MKKLMVARLFLLGLPDLILAEKAVPDRQLLINAEQQAKVFHADAGPFQLDVDLVGCVRLIENYPILFFCGCVTKMSQRFSPMPRPVGRGDWFGFPLIVCTRTVSLRF